MNVSKRVQEVYSQKYIKLERVTDILTQIMRSHLGVLPPSWSPTGILYIDKLDS